MAVHFKSNQGIILIMEKLFEIKHLIKKFPIYSGFFNKPVSYTHALNNVSFDIYKGEVLGVAGESGCGKTTLGRCILNLIPYDSAQILFNKKDISGLSPAENKEFRAKAQFVFQNPYASLNPRMTVYQILKEPLVIHKYPKNEIEAKVLEVVRAVGLRDSDVNKYAHEFSGGQRQRIAIARALILNPEFIVADEPVSALDVSIQAQIINMLLELKEKFNLTILFISHDLSVIRHVANRVAIMYLGEIVEVGNVEEVYDNPKHPYTKILLSAIPTIARRQVNTALFKNELPVVPTDTEGCRFCDRCPYVMDQCKVASVPEKHFSDTHFSRCYLG